MTTERNRKLRKQIIDLMMLLEEIETKEQLTRDEKQGIRRAEYGMLMVFDFARSPLLTMDRNG